MGADLLFSFKLSALVACLATLISGVLGTAIAYLLARGRFPLKGLLALIVSMPLVLPPTVTGYYLVVVLGRRGWLGAPLYALTGWSLPFTWQAAVVAATVVSLPLMVQSARAAFESLETEWWDLASVMGASEWVVAWRVALPLAWRGLVAGLILSFIRALGEFGATLMLAGNIPGRTNTLPLEIFTAFERGDDARIRIAVLLLTGLSAGVLAIANRLAARQARS